MRDPVILQVRNWLLKIRDFLRELAHGTFPRPAYDSDPAEHPMNQPNPEPVAEAVPPKPIEPKKTPEQIVVEAARSALNRDVTPGDEVPDGVACVAQLVAVLSKTENALPKSLTYTPYLLDVLKSHKKWKATLTPKAGCIIISPTVGETNKGHCGIFLTETRIASNDSQSGLWRDNYSFDSWVRYFKTGKSMHVYIFEPV